MNTFYKYKQTWSSDLCLLDEAVFWNVLHDLLCDLPRVDLHALNLHHLKRDDTVLHPPEHAY